VKYTWHATKTQILPRIVSLMGPKSCHDNFVTTPTHKLRRKVRAIARIECMSYSWCSAEKGQLIFSWPQLTVAASAVWAAALEALQHCLPNCGKLGHQ
jgi:hypothetical protein